MCLVQIKHKVMQMEPALFSLSLALFTLAGCALRIYTQVSWSAECNIIWKSCHRFERFGIIWMLYLASCQTNYDIGMSEIHLPLIISMRASDSEATSWQLPTPSLRSLVPNFLPALPLLLWAIGHISSSSNFSPINFLALSVSTFGQLANCNRLCLDLCRPRCLTSPRFQTPFPPL